MRAPLIVIAVCSLKPSSVTFLESSRRGFPAEIEPTVAEAKTHLWLDIQSCPLCPLPVQSLQTPMTLRPSQVMHAMLVQRMAICACCCGEP
eukprot:1213422-Amphidinium_carterae.1